MTRLFHPHGPIYGFSDLHLLCLFHSCFWKRDRIGNRGEKYIGLFLSAMFPFAYARFHKPGFLAPGIDNCRVCGFMFFSYVFAVDGVSVVMMPDWYPEKYIGVVVAGLLGGIVLE